MKLSQYAKQQGISYSTALRWWHQGVIQGYQAPSGTIIVEAETKPPAREEKVVIYARVSSAEHKENLERQVELLVQYCTVRGYQVAQVVKEIASGVNDSRPKLLALLKDRLTRFGFRYLETLLELQGRTSEVVNVATNDKEDLIADLVAIVSMYGVKKKSALQLKQCVEQILKDE